MYQTCPNSMCEYHGLRGLGNVIRYGFARISHDVEVRDDVQDTGHASRTYRQTIDVPNDLHGRGGWKAFLCHHCRGVAKVVLAVTDACSIE